jgi:predicted nucleic acid-binding protein
MKKTFIDSNLIIYANDSKDISKQNLAIELIKTLMKSGNGVISTQVLQEYANVALNKLHQSQDVVVRQLTLLESLEVVQITPVLIKRSIEIKITYKTSFWDAVIISAAEASRCDMILSEDFNSGQLYSGIKISNPF